MIPSPRQRNFYISYIKGFAIIAVLLVHLIDWSNVVLSQTQIIAKEILYTAVLFFISTVGSVAFIAYHHHEDLQKPTKRLITRGFQLIGIYFLYNLMKLPIYNFQQEPFYYQFINQHKFSVTDILTLQSFSVPITIILTIGLFLLIAPLFLWIAKKTKHPKSIIITLIVLLVMLNYLIPLPSNPVTDFLMSKHTVMFSLLQWSLPFTLGFYLAMMGFEKVRNKAFPLFTLLTILCGSFLFTTHQPLYISWYMYPLRPYYIVASFCWMYMLIYLFTWMEKIDHPLMNHTLALVRFLGDHTLSLYIYHWIVVDITLWMFAPQAKMIWWTVALFFIVFVIMKRNKLKAYFHEQRTTN
jgi:peptidoglycan/LPS O-acetylase OafA/YrhL